MAPVGSAPAPMTTVSLLIICAMLGGGIVSGSAFLIVGGAVGFVSWALLDLLSLRQRAVYRRSAAATRSRHAASTG